MSSALALSRATTQSLTVYWFSSRALNCPYFKLFEPIDGVEVVEVATGRLRAPLSRGAKRLKAVDKQMPYDLFLSGDKIEELSEQGADVAEVASQAQRCGIETYGRFYGTAPYYEDFIAKPELTDEVDKTWAEMTEGGGGAPAIGVHIRRSDNDASMQVSPLDLFIARMEQEAEREPETRFFLATDDIRTDRTVFRHFPGRVISRNKQFSRKSTLGVQDALIDLLVLSKCSLILGSYWSSFSQTAAEMRGATLEIVRTPQQAS